MTTKELKYIDADSYQQYESFQGEGVVEIHLEKNISCQDVGKVYDEWIQHVWRGFPVIQEGTGRGQAVGNIRVVTGNIKEQILAVGEPTTTDTDSEEAVVPSILYKVISGPFPAKDHLGLVSFISDPPSSTVLVRWESKIEPTMMGNVLCCGLMGAGIQKLLGGFLDDFASQFDK